MAWPGSQAWFLTLPFPTGSPNHQHQPASHRQQPQRPLDGPPGSASCQHYTYWAPTGYLLGAALGSQASLAEDLSFIPGVLVTTKWLPTQPTVSNKQVWG